MALSTVLRGDQCSHVIAFVEPSVNIILVSGVAIHTSDAKCCVTRSFPLHYQSGRILAVAFNATLVRGGHHRIELLLRPETAAFLKGNHKKGREKEEGQSCNDVSFGR
jgi:hypothetical protein